MKVWGVSVSGLDFILEPCNRVVVFLARSWLQGIDSRKKVSSMAMVTLGPKGHGGW